VKVVTGPLTSIETSLLDDIELIELEHESLRELLDEIEDTCCNIENNLGCETCDNAQCAACEGRFNSYLYGLLHISALHFAHEESKLLSQLDNSPDSGQVKAHKKEHLKIIEKLEKLADECEVLSRKMQSAEAYRILHANVVKLFEEHERLMDGPLLLLIGQKLLAR
jgi:hemerythrin